MAEGGRGGDERRDCACSGVRPREDLAAQAASIRHESSSVGRVNGLSTEPTASCRDGWGCSSTGSASAAVTKKESDGRDPLEQCPSRRWSWTSGKPRHCTPEIPSSTYVV